jgi:phosphoglycolate phosphatase
MSARFNPAAILFDLDGTLLDTITDLADAANLMLVELDRPVLSQAQIHGCIGQGIANLVQRILVGSGMTAAGADVTAPVALDVFRRHYARVNGRTTRPYSGVSELLAALAARGLKMAVVTNKSTVFTLPLLQQFDLARYFGAVVCGDTLPTKKPDPDVIFYSCDLLGIKPEQALMIGDSANDALAARAAGVPVLLVRYGYSEGIPVTSMDCDGLLSDAIQVLDYLSP